MKKLFTLLALLTCFLGANAIEIVDAEVDFSQYSDISEVKWYGWGASSQALERLSIKDGCLHFESSEVPLNDNGEPTGWLAQFHPIGGVSAEVDVTYTVHFKIKGDHEENISLLGFGTTPYGQFPVTTEWVEGTIDYVCTKAEGDMLMQSGGYIGSWDLAYLKITHEGKEEKPVNWIEILDNGDAEKPWGDLAEVKWNDKENNFKICAWAKERERMTETNDDGSESFVPFPADIVEDPDDPSNHVFICDGRAAITEGDPAAWDNQFWIQSPQEWAAGEEFQLKFRYKASKTVKAQTQIHHQNPSDYLIWHAIGDITFTEEWQTFDQTVTMGDDMGGGWSIAFNLNANDKDAIKFYFDDISWKKMDLKEGYFVAYANADNGIEYDFDEAIEFVEDAELEAMVATVGKEGKQDTWVKEVMISTVYGNSKAFKAKTIKPSGAINDPEAWTPIANASNFKIELPAAGVWRIAIDTKENSINFFEIEGDQPFDPVEFVANPTEVVIDATAQIEQPWDAQFWVYTEEALPKGTETVIEFDYMMESDELEAATAGTQCHAAPGAYLHWGAIGDVKFTGEWQHFSQTFTVPNEGDNMQSIAFNLSQGSPVKFHIKGFIWGLSNHKASLIDMESGDKNFYIKEGKTAEGAYQTHLWGTDPIFVLNKVEGDANGDNIVDVSDIDTIIELIGTEFDETNEDHVKADVNGDKTFDVSDIDYVIEKIK